jgi:hypothetical protein
MDKLFSEIPFLLLGIWKSTFKIRETPQVGAIDQLRYLRPGNVKAQRSVTKFTMSLVISSLGLLHF